MISLLAERAETTALGALAVPINVGYRGDFLCHQLADSGATVAAVDAERLTALTEVRSACLALRTVVLVHPEEHAGPRADVTPFAALFDHGRMPLAARSGGDAATILYTSAGGRR